ncbi:SRPBCC family protein [Kaistella palustris]|uniref:SRPBCC family protein n=1 Tax=Kaistella palustris TaxID=493376 RepID=UPI0003FF7434|nr:SRPBCC domain-containing protein [Kaistella palustris]
MKKIQFTVFINASVEKVWNTLWDDDTYRKWTASFIKGSYYEGELAEGNEIRFLSPGEHGLFALVEKVVPFQKMHFLHYGEVIDGIPQEKTFGDEAIEYYDLEEKENGTELTVTINTAEEFLTYFTNSFPRALNIVKELAEE